MFQWGKNLLSNVLQWSFLQYPINDDFGDVSRLKNFNLQKNCDLEKVDYLIHQIVAMSKRLVSSPFDL